MRCLVEPAVAHGRLLVDREHARRRGDEHRAVGRDEAGTDRARRLQQLAGDHQVDLAGRRIERQHGARARRAVARAGVGHQLEIVGGGARALGDAGIEVPCTKCPLAIAAACSQEASTPPPSPPSAAISSLMGFACATRVTPPARGPASACRRAPSAAEQAHERRRQPPLQAIPATSGSG